MISEANIVLQGQLWELLVFTMPCSYAYTKTTCIPFINHAHKPIEQLRPIENVNIRQIMQNTTKRPQHCREER